MTVAAPFAVSWYLTKRCDLSCRHCFVPVVRPDDARGEVDTATAKRFIASIWNSDVYILSFAGGEPMLRQDFFELARFARDLGLTVLTSTNAQRLDDATLDRIVDAGFQSLQVSLDGLSAAPHEAIRGAGTFDVARRGLELTMRRSVGGLKVVLAVALHRRILPELDAILAFARESGIFSLKLQPVARPFRYADGTPGHISEDEAARAIAHAKRGLDGSRVQLAYASWVDLFLRGDARQSCALGLRTAIVDAEGRVSTCDEMPGTGDAIGGSFSDAWEAAVREERARPRCGCYAFRDRKRRLLEVA